MLTDILTITLNPDVSMVTSVERLLDAHKLRCSTPQRDPGGGGINVARVVHRLGGDCLAFYLAGGTIGQVLQSLLDAERVPSHCLRIAGETRENFTVHETATDREFRFIVPGPTITRDEWQHCVNTLDAIDAPRFLVLSGSVPPGVSLDDYAAIVRRATARGTRVVLDTSGPALAAALDAGVYFVKPSLQELRGLTGHTLTTEASWRDAARDIVRSKRASIVALTLGEHGALLVTEDQILRAPGWPVTVSTSVGAGDSFVGAMVWALNRDAPLDQAFRYALATATATLLSVGTRLCNVDDAMRIYREMSASDTFIRTFDLHEAS